MSPLRKSDEISGLMEQAPCVIVLSCWNSPILVPSLQALHEARIPISGIVFDGEKSQRSLSIHQERTKGYYKDHTIFEFTHMQIPCFFVSDHNDTACLSLIKHLHADLMVNGGVRRILKPNLIKVVPLGILNSHPGLLPKYRGCSSLEWAIYHDEPVGASCHFMSQEIDAGPVIYSEEMPVVRGQVYEEVRSRIINHTAKVLAKGAKRVVDEGLNPSDLSCDEPQGYFKVIPDAYLNVVKGKLAKGTYACSVYRNEVASLTERAPRACA